VGLAAFDGQVISPKLVTMRFDPKDLQFAIIDAFGKTVVSGSYQEHVIDDRHGELDLVGAAQGNAVPPFRKSGQLAKAVYFRLDQDVEIAVAPPDSPRPPMEVFHRRHLDNKSRGVLYLSIYSKGKP
jgi:hypothetical protein